MEEINGWLNVNKPIGWRSTKVVAIIKRITGAKKVGHGGTLDPFASGVLPICINKATKQVEMIMDHKKQYIFQLTFGEMRDTYDIEGQVIDRNDFIPQEIEIKNIIKNFIGEIQQKPPIFSALKVNGKRAYDLARQGEQFELKTRTVLIENIKYNGFIDKNTVEFVLDCGRGCYIRSLAVDIAKSLGAVGYVSKLTRTKIGEFDIKDSLNDIQNVSCETIKEKIVRIN